MNGSPRSHRTRRGPVGVLLASLATTALVVASLAAGAPSFAQAVPDAPGAVEGATTLAPIAPCRLADTRDADGGQRLDAHTIRVDVIGECEIPDGATAAAFTVTAVDTTAAGYVTMYPTGIERPLAANINADKLATVTNSAVVVLGEAGSVDVYHSGEGDIVVDVTAVFVPRSTAVAEGRFVPVGPRRLADTRTSGQRGADDLVVDTSAVVPADAVAVAVTVTAVRAVGPGYVTAWTAGEPEPDTATLTVDVLNDTRAATAIVASLGDSTGLAIHRSTTMDIVVDITGYFTGASVDPGVEGMFVPQAPTRAFDTRTSDQPLHPDGTMEVALSDDDDVSAVVTNLAATAMTRPGYITAWPAGTPRPTTSSLNATWRSPLSSFAIIALSDRGAALFSNAGTHVVVDVAGHFTGVRQTASEPPATNSPPNNGGRVLFVSDSSFAGIRWTGALSSLVGADFDSRLESCRRLSGSSCRGREGYTPYTAAYEVTRAGPGYDTLVIATGYNDYAGTFPRGFEAVMTAARANGTRRVVWLTYREPVGYTSPRGASNASTFVANNRHLDVALASGSWPELELASWNTYTANRSSWLTPDGVHLTYQGGRGAASYVSRKLAALDRRVCPDGAPGPATSGGWCADPDVTGV